MVNGADTNPDDHRPRESLNEVGGDADIPSGVKQAAEKALFLAKSLKSIPQGLKPTLI
jgi:hypothetical protein